jgi:cysteine-S-conjugate beta-lyase
MNTAIIASETGLRQVNVETSVVHAGGGVKDGAVNVPVHRASTLLFPSVRAYEEAASHRFETPAYARYGTPTTRALELALAEVEGGYSAKIFPSGLAAISTALLSVLRAGDHLLVSDSVYAPTRMFCDGMLTRFGVETTFFDPNIGAEFESLFRTNTAAVFLESPGSMTFEVQDVPRLADLAHKHRCIVLTDNTWATPLFFRPFKHGVDISIQAATKYIVGHSDALLGAVVVGDRAVEDRVRTAWAELGQTAGPDECYLALRGLRTLDVRMRRHNENALHIAEWLSTRPEVQRVLYPALESCPGHVFWKRDYLGASGLLGVELRPYSAPAISSMVDGLELFGIGAGWGGCESLALPVHTSNYRPNSPQFGPMLRLHVGLENPQDLIDDLERGFRRLTEGTT